MSEGLLTVLKICFLALLYLFLLRVVIVVVREMRTTRVPIGEPVPVAAAAPAPVASPQVAPKRSRRGGPAALKVVEPAERRGQVLPLGDEITVGRAAGCAIVLDDSFVSQVHARLSTTNGELLLEDLGSTNGTFLNGERISAPARLRRGDRIQFGSTVVEVTR